VPGDVLRHLPHDLGVDLQQVHPAHAWLTRQARRDHHDAGAFDRFVPLTVRPGGDAHHCGLVPLDGPRLVDVERQSFRLAFNDVGQHDSVEDVVLGQPLRGGRPVEAGTDDGYLFGSYHSRTLTGYHRVPPAGHDGCGAVEAPRDEHVADATITRRSVDTTRLALRDPIARRPLEGT